MPNPRRFTENTSLGGFHSVSVAFTAIWVLFAVCWCFFAAICAPLPSFPVFSRPGRFFALRWRVSGSRPCLSRETQKTYAVPARVPLCRASIVSCKHIFRRLPLSHVFCVRPAKTVCASRRTVLQYSVAPSFLRRLPCRRFLPHKRPDGGVFPFRPRISASPSFWAKTPAVFSRSPPFLFAFVSKSAPCLFGPPVFHVKHFRIFTARFPPFLNLCPKNSRHPIPPTAPNIPDSRSPPHRLSASPGVFPCFT